LTVREPDEQRLPAPAKRQIESPRLKVGGHGDGVRSLKARNGPSEGFLEVVAFKQVRFNGERDGLGIRGHAGVNKAPGRLARPLDFQVVVDVSV